jgi:hypothetical protein
MAEKVMKHKMFWGIVLIIAGIGIFTYAIFSNNLLQNSTNKYGIKDFAAFFGEKAGRIILKIAYCIVSTALIVSGVALMVL